jgi:hypothetical protein
MKRLITIALVVCSLAAVPAAFADDSTAPAPPAATGQQQQQQRTGHLRLRLKIVTHRFRKRCGSDNSGQACVDVANKVAERLAKLDSKVQQRIAKIQETCVATSTDERCKNADERIARLQKADERLQVLVAKVQAWLSGDQSAGDLNQLVGANG